MVWKLEIDKAWVAYTGAWKADNPDIAVPKTWFEFQNMFLKEKFEQETEEMKLRVEEHREKMTRDKALLPNEKNLLFQG